MVLIVVNGLVQRGGAGRNDTAVAIFERASTDWSVITLTGQLHHERRDLGLREADVARGSPCRPGAS